MRNQGIDIARFLAFAGMVLVNFRIAAELATGGGWGGADIALGWAEDWPATITMLIEGRAAALFVILAGVSLALGSARWHLVLRRALFLFAIGMGNMLIFDADILHFYGLYFAGAALFLGATNRSLLFGAALLVGLGTLAQITLDYNAGWDWDRLAYADFWTLTGFLRHSLFNGWHPLFPWLAFLLFGLWLGRLKLDHLPVQLSLLIGGTLVAYLGERLSQRLIELPELGEVLGTAPLPPGPLYMLVAGAAATALLGATLLITPLIRLLRVELLFVAPGRMTLTLYVAHIVIGMGLLEAMGLLDGQMSSPGIFAYSIGFVTISALFALFWLRKFRRGPLEALMRITTEGKL
ncbi:hypothetical protein XMM379_002930 [Aliiroseovarius sp. xm-m-379]|uniref:DUF418 domain-containing protein n=1 Tax=unclassified Aliiroseovarius TaxID=2623558 RepID=UPI0015691EC8|nr:MULTISPECIES: DUF418 domain-containing protein [unclassified Aliiroseovarius]NRP12560.1 hypothetical protein [Aliiroseovarius sp. xm-d-517]NRP26221.1 hypothetical protein [Aliiroseovarius sp. xm-m-379]NRP31788.1 hypothetical protein [Aliiroseovarius sp. xm-m-314]NRP35020.1 hypothetical protein [Aliiroseovarius sp. xm-a-104]NRP42513.1 hypothetical protein [Aliiroseovarius sp. xm-m-339-2]